MNKNDYAIGRKILLPVPTLLIFYSNVSIVILFQTANYVLPVQLIYNKFSMESIEATTWHTSIIHHSEHTP